MHPPDGGKIAATIFLARTLLRGPFDVTRGNNVANQSKNPRDDPPKHDTMLRHGTLGGKKAACAR